MDPDANMIDNMMGEHRFGNGAVGNLAPSSRKGVNSFSDISNKMRSEARRLEIIAKKNIPRAFPLSPPKGSSDREFSHTPVEFMGSSWYTEIYDGLFAIDTVNEIFTIGEGLQLILNSLFPNSFNTGSWEMEIPDQFEQAKQTLNEGMGKVKECLDELKEGIDASPAPTINLTEMEKFKKHAIRLAFEYIKTGKVPTELLERTDLVMTPEAINRERMRLNHIAREPVDMTNVLLDSGTDDSDKDDTDERNVEKPGLLSDDIFKRFKTFKTGE